MTAPVAFAHTLLLFFPKAAIACTMCDSAIGNQVRAAIFNHNFWPTALAVAAPFPVLLIGLATYQFGFPRFGRGSSKKSEKETRD